MVLKRERLTNFQSHLRKGRVAGNFDAVDREQEHQGEGIFVIDSAIVPVASKIALSVAMLALLVVVGMAATLASTHVDRKTKAIELEQSAIPQASSVQGLPAGETLDKSYNSYDEGYVYYSDRILERFFANSDAVALTSQVDGDFFASLPDEVGKYLVIAPSRIAFETSCASLSGDQRASIDTVYAAMPEDVTCVDAFTPLAEQMSSEAYVYYRTQNTWTPRGAYCAARQMMEQAGIDAIPLDSYTAESLNDFTGGLIIETGWTEHIESDSCEYFILHGAKNAEQLTRRISSGVYRVSYPPAVARSRTGVDISIGGSVSDAILEGDAADAGALLVVGNSYAKPFSTWMTPYYSRVIYVSYEWFQGDADALQQMIVDYDVRDVVLVQPVAACERGKSLGGITKLTVGADRADVNVSLGAIEAAQAPAVDDGEDAGQVGA